MKKILSRIQKRLERVDLSGKNIFKELRIEINADCNRACHFCPRHLIEKRKKSKERMSTDMVLSIIDQSIALGFKGRVGFDVLNEPTLDERLFYFLDYVLDRNLETIIFTNGDVFRNDPVYAVKLFKRVSSKVFLSLYDYTDQAGRERLIQEWKTYLSGLNIAEEKVEFVGNYFTFGTRGGLVKRNTRYMSEERLRRIEKRLPLHAACKKFLVKLEVQYDGVVPFCDEDVMCRGTLGNVHESSIEDIWFGQRRTEVAQTLARGDREALTPCSECLASPLLLAGNKGRAM